MSSKVQERPGISINRNLYKVCCTRRSGCFYHNDYHTQVNFTCLDRMYSDKLLCDVVLVSEGMEIQAHKVILATCSAFFYIKFSSERKLGTLNCIPIRNINYETLHTVVDYFYKSRVLITDENVKDLLEASFELAVPDLQEACWDFLRENLTPQNCLKASKIAVYYHNEDLVPIIEDFVTDHFSLIIRYDEFLQLAYEEILNLISRDRPSSVAEEILDCIIRWTVFDPAFRKHYFKYLIDYVQLSLISLPRILQIIDEQHWLQNEPQFMIKYMKSLSLERSVTPPIKPSKLLVAVGVTSNFNLDLEMYDFEKNVWLPGPDVVKIKCSSDTKVAIHGTAIYCFEGNQMKSIDISGLPGQMMWSTCKNMMEHRLGGYSIAIFNNNIYTTGGYSGSKYMAIAKKYVTGSGQWEGIADMPEGRYRAGLGSVKGQLYAVGGTTDICRYSNLVRCWKQYKDCWNVLPAMSVGRDNPGVGALGNSLFVVGGYNSDGWCKQVESFELGQSTWSQLPDMTVARSAPGVIDVNGQLYVVGGSNGNFLNSVEIYDPKSNNWSMLPSTMNTRKCYVAVALVDKSVIKF